MATPIRQLPERFDYEIWQGDTFAPGTLTAYEDLSMTSTINFTGYSAKIEFRNAYTEALAATLTSPSDGITLSNAGVITITMPAETTKDLSGRYKYDLEITDPNGIIRTYTYGILTVTNDTTDN